MNLLLESAAAEVIAGLTLISANEEAVATLIVNHHMDLLLNLEALTSLLNLKGLRQLLDIMDVYNVRGLKALGVPASSSVIHPDK